MGAKFKNFILLFSTSFFCQSSFASTQYFSHLTVEDAELTKTVTLASQLNGIGPHLIEIHNKPLLRSNIVLRAHYFKAENPKALVLGVHGLQSNARWFMQSGMALAKAGISVLVYDRRGSGLSDGNKRYFGLPINFDPNPEEIKVAEGLRGHVRTGIILRRLVLNSSAEFISDINASYKKLVDLNKDKFKSDGKNPLDVYVLANCFGSRIAIPYALKNSKIKSLIITAPATDMEPRADIENIFDKADITVPLIHFGGPLDYLKSPLQDNYFVSPESPAYAGIVNNKVSLSLRYATGDFFWATRNLTKKMENGISKLNIPLLIVLGKNDVMVNNKAIRERFRREYQAHGKILTFDAEHMLEFTPAGPSFIKATQRWIEEDQRSGFPTNMQTSDLAYLVKDESENIGSAALAPAPAETKEATPKRKGFWSNLFKKSR